MMPMPVTARRVEVSALRILARKIKLAANHFHSIDEAASRKPERAAELRVERADGSDHIAGLDETIDFAAVDAGEKRVRARISKCQTATQLRHRLNAHHTRRHRIVDRADVDALDCLIAGARRSGGSAKRNLMREAGQPAHACACCSASRCSTNWASAATD